MHRSNLPNPSSADGEADGGARITFQPGSHLQHGVVSLLGSVHSTRTRGIKGDLFWQQAMDSEAVHGVELALVIAIARSCKITTLQTRLGI